MYHAPLKNTLSRLSIGLVTTALLASGATAAVTAEAAGTTTSAALPNAAPTDAGWSNSRGAERRARALLRRMTLAEKIDMLHGEVNFYYGFYNAPIERLGIPALTMADGPAGVRIANPDVNDQQATELPSPLALAATWNAVLAQEYGERAGDEAHRTGHNVLLAPALDIARVAQAGRAFEAFGEDPLISGRMGGAVIRGIQENPAAADLKHYNLYTQEQNRLIGGNAVVDERTLQEIYTRPFDIAIKQGDPASAMCAFNKVNGTYACENDYLLNEILKVQLEFEGWVMSDYGATHSTVASILGGMDQEMPGDFGGGDCFFCAPLVEAVNEGDVPVSRINDAVMRILRPMFGLGLFDEPARVRPLPEGENGAFAREVSEQATVLLRNRRRTLPLDDDLDSIAVIGADADHAVQGGGSSQVLPTYTVSPLEGITERADGATVTHARGNEPVTSAALLPGPDPIPSDFLRSALDGEPGLRVEYFDNPARSGSPALDRTEPYAGIYGGFFLFEGFNAASPHFPAQSNENTSGMRWTGTLTAPVTGTYELAVTTNGVTTLFLDDAPVITTETATDPTSPGVHRYEVDLVAGQEYDLRAEFSVGPSASADFGSAFKLGWVPPRSVVEPSIAEAAEVAADADVAVVFARDYGSEGGDRPNLDLPNAQDDLIREVAAANRRTIVVLTASAAVQTSDWEDDVRSVLHNWYGGQEQGSAIARILFGDVNPSGKLPLTIPVDEESTPVSDEDQYPGDGLDQQFSEGIFVGYRGYEERGIEPSYPFGHGLSYTRFDYRRLLLSSNTRGRGSARATKSVKVSVDVRNVGRRRGSETVQVYVGNLPTRRVDTAEKALAGWAKVDLRPGQRRRVTVNLDPQSFSYWDTARDRWRTPDGRVPIYVGSSSEDLRLAGSIRISGGRAR
ncbi:MULTISPECIES: glycoside hydrolase family 3 protein [Aeromicrobium]|uniref:glycoside hydrolase family 3 protein n=1 Tax=Aeromicrobium TaxID=2040 RepID=UPI00257E5217|nr:MULTISPECIES: glycoside hydrolase family 3 C-terminal domain-containing protein [Aeromicrobium]